MIEIWKILFITLFKQPLHRGSVPPSCFKPILLVSWPYCSSSFQQLHPVAKYEEDGASASAPEGFYPSKLPRQPSWLPRWSVTQEKSAHTLSLWHFKFNTWVLAEMREQRSLPWEPHFPYMVTGNIFHNVMQLTHFRTIHARAGLPHKRQTCILSGSCPSRWTTTLPKLFTGLAWSSKQSHFAEGALSLWAQATNFPFLF